MIEEIGLRGWIFYIRFKDRPRIVMDLSNIIELAIIFGIFALAYNAGQHDAIAYNAYWYWYTHSYCLCPGAYDAAMRDIIPHYVSVTTIGGINGDSAITSAMPKYIGSPEYNDGGCCS